jgi:hypothetical protein
VLYFGQNIATTENDEFLPAFGGDRVRVTPISETAEIGMAVGAALAGYRPVTSLDEPDEGGPEGVNGTAGQFPTVNRAGICPAAPAHRWVDLTYASRLRNR